MKRIRLLLAAVSFGGALIVAAPAAQAACHAFTVRAEPAQVAEGGKVAVTVTRDSNASPSQVEVSSVDGTAKSGEDYPAQRRTISFVAETQQSFEIPITDDPVSEGDETFELRLSNPGGCAVNPNFQVGPAATVTVQRNDATPVTAAPATAAPPTAAPPTAAPPTAAPRTAAPTTSAPAKTSTTKSGGATTVPSAVPSLAVPSIEPTTTAPSPTTTGSEETDQALTAAGDDDDDGSSAIGLVVAAVVAAAALGGAGYFLYRRRRLL